MVIFTVSVSVQPCTVTPPLFSLSLHNPPSLFLTSYLSVPLRINVSLEGQFLHYIHRHQFLDSPEWESLRPNEEGKFQVVSAEGNRFKDLSVVVKR